MTLSKEQIKEAKNFCKANGLNVKLVTKTLGNGFWMEECKGSFEGYLSYLKADNSNGSVLGGVLLDCLKKSPVQKMYREVKENTFN